MNAHYAGGVNNYLNSRPNHTKNLAHLCNLFLRFGKFSPQICESCAVELWCNLMTELWNLCCVEKHIQSSNWRREKRPNRSVYLATLSFHYESDENLRFGIWRSAVAPCDSTEKNGNMGTQLQSLRCTRASKIFWKIYFLYDFWGAQLVHSDPFLD